MTYTPSQYLSRQLTVSDNARRMFGLPSASSFARRLAPWEEESVMSDGVETTNCLRLILQASTFGLAKVKVWSKLRSCGASVKTTPSPDRKRKYKDR